MNSKKVKLKISPKRFFVNKNRKVEQEILPKQFLFTKNRRGIVSEYLPWLIIGLAILAIIMVAIFLLKEKGILLIDKIKDLFGGGEAWLSLQ